MEKSIKLGNDVSLDEIHVNSNKKKFTVIGENCFF